MKSSVYFSTIKLKSSYEQLAKDSKNHSLFKSITKAISDLKQDAFCGIQIQKKLIPKMYVNKYGIDNLWKYNLSGGWRLLYSVASNKVLIVTILLEWTNHKNYEKRFKY